MTSPTNLKYIKDHDWVCFESDGKATLGVTDFAQESLGDVVFVELREIGEDVTQFQPFGEIESVKAVSELVSPISGTVIDRNDEIFAKPELVNQSAYGEGWLIKVKVSAATDMSKLMDADDYDTFIESDSA